MQFAKQTMDEFGVAAIRINWNSWKMDVYVTTYYYLFQKFKSIKQDKYIIILNKIENQYSDRDRFFFI